MPHHPAHKQQEPAGAAAPPPAAPIAVAPGQTLLFLGDSITAAEPGYLDVLRQALAQTRPDLDLRLVNAGVPGDTIRDLAARLDRDVLAQHPAWVLICIGANDYYRPALAAPAVPLAEFADRYRALVARLQEAGSAPILLTIPVVGFASDERTIPDPRAYNDAIRALAAAADLPLIDVHRAFYEVYERAANYKQTVSLSSDGLHPNSQGYALIARTLLVQLGLLRK